MVLLNSYFTRRDFVRIVAVFIQQQFSKFIIQISHLWLEEGWKQWCRQMIGWREKGQRRRRSKCVGGAWGTCSIKAALASRTSCRSCGSSDWSRGLLSNARPSSPWDLALHSSFWLVIKSTTPEKFFPLPTGICKTQRFATQFVSAPQYKLYPHKLTIILKIYM